MHERLTKARIDAGYSSRAAATTAHGWHLSTYTAHEKGQNKYDADAAIAYAKAFKVSPEWLMFGSQPYQMKAPPGSIDGQLQGLPQPLRQKFEDRFNAMLEGVKILGKIE